MNPWILCIFAAAYGACVGSFLNVVVYRVPAGKSLWWPGSHCPKCSHKLAWSDNIPVLGWLFLRGRCRYCKAPISAQYPAVEAATALLFLAVVYAYYYATLPASGGPTSMPIALNSAFQIAGPGESWPVLIVHLALVAGLIAATLIDAKLFIIPLRIPYTVLAVALLVLPAAAYFRSLDYPLPPPAVAGQCAWMAVGGIAGLALAIALLWFGVLPQSFPETDHAAHDSATATGAPSAPRSTGAAASKGAARLVPLVIVAVIAVSVALAFLLGARGLLLGAVLVWWAVLPLSLRASPEEPAEPSGPETWYEFPHPRIEILKESLFVALPVIGGLLGWLIAGHHGATIPPVSPLDAAWRTLAAVLLGFLIGGGIVWFIRILGTLTFGREAMGLGDAHLMGAIGAVLGADDVLLIFFLAPFFALGFTAVATGLTQVFKQKRTEIPYGPHLAGTTLIIMLCGEPVRLVLGRLIGWDLRLTTLLCP